MITFRYLDLAGVQKKQTEITKIPSGSDSILDLLDDTGVKLPFGCRAGSCGVCRTRVLEGFELLEPLGLGEEDTLSRCQDPPQIRLACAAMVKAGASGVLVLQAAPDIV